MSDKGGVVGPHQGLWAGELMCVYRVTRVYMPQVTRNRLRKGMRGSNK